MAFFPLQKTPAADIIDSAAESLSTSTSLDAGLALSSAIPGEQGLPPGASGAILAAAIIILLMIAINRLLFICGPDEVLIFSGRTQQLPDGSNVGYRAIFGGRHWKTPFIERVDRMSLRLIPIDIYTNNAYSKGGIPLKVHAIASVKVADNPLLINHAIERFLGRDISEMRRVAKETLEGHLRGVIAKLTPEEVNEDRLKFAGALIEEAVPDFNKLGLQLDILKIQSVSDDEKYMASLGRERIAAVLRDAEIAESTASADAAQQEAVAKQEGDVSKKVAETAIVKKSNELQRITAELEAEARSEELITEQAALEARALAESKLQEIRAKVEAARLEADVILPAKAAQQAEEWKALGDAASILEDGKALAEALSLMTDVWKRAGSDAKEIFLIQNLEGIVNTVVKRVNAIDVGEVHLLDSGDGDSLAKYAAAYPAMVAQILAELQKTTGVDVIGILSPEEVSS
jgi:flotillin